MECDFPTELILGLWQKFSRQDHVYVVLLNGAMPFIEDPNLIPQEMYLQEGQEESLVLAFLTKEDAASYAEMLPEIHNEENLRPSALSVAKVTKHQLFSMIEELTQISLDDYQYPIRIDLAQKLSGDSVLTDVLYSSFLPVS